VLLDAKACYDTLSCLAQRIIQVRDSDHRGSCIVADDRFAFLLKGCLKGGQGLDAISSIEATDPKKTYLVSAHPVGLPLELLRAHGIPDANITVIDTLTACCLVASALKSNFSYLCDHTSSLMEFLFWAETLAMFEHGFGDSQFPDDVLNLSTASDIRQLSQTVAREQVRLAILSRILRTFVEWTP